MAGLSKGTKRGAIVASVLALVLAACAGTPSASPGKTSEASPTGPSGPPIKIGVVHALSGAAAAFGTVEVQALELAIKEANEAGGVAGRMIELVIRDDQSSPDVGVGLLQQLIDDEDVLAIVGGSFSPTQGAYSPIADEEGIVLVSPTATLTSGNYPFEYTYHLIPGIPPGAEALAKRIEDLGATRVGLLTLERDYGQLGSRLMNDLAADYGYEIVEEQAGADDDTDFSAQLTAIRSADPDALIVWMANPAGATALRNAADLGLDVPILSPVSMANRALIEVAGDAANGVVLFSALAPADPLERQQDFVAAFEAEYDVADPGVFEAAGYDSGWLLVRAMEQAAEEGELTRASIQEKLSNLQHEGVAGIYDFAAQREPLEESVLLIQVVEGRFERVD